MAQNTSNNSANGSERTGLGLIIILFGVLLAVFTLFGVISTVTGLELQVKGVPLPKTWGDVMALGAVCLFFWAIWAVINFVKPLRRLTRERPWIAGLLVVGFIVGLIVGITIWDNGNIKAREEARMAEAKADSLERVADNKVFFEGKTIPYRLAVLNPESAPIEVWVDSQAVGNVAAYGGTELQLPWQPARISVRQGGKELDAIAIQPDSKQADSANVLHVFSPMEKLHIWLFDYETGYENGKLVTNKEFECDYVDSYYHDKFIEIHRAGPFYILPNQKAPESTKFHPYRLVVLPDGIEEPRDNRPLAWWIMRHVDSQPDGSPAQSPDELYEAWKAR